MTAPRSGSTLLALALWRTGCLGAPMEYLNLDTLQRDFDIEDDALFLEYWTLLKRTRTSPNGVFGIKLFANFAYAIQQRRPALFEELFACGKSIILTRRDRIAQAVSLARALQTKRWFSGDPELRPPRYSFKQIASALRRIRAFEQWWELLIEARGIEPLRLVYEDIRSDLGKATATIAEFLEVTLVCDRTPELMPVDAQSDDISRQWQERFRREFSPDWNY